MNSQSNSNASISESVVSRPSSSQELDPPLKLEKCQYQKRVCYQPVIESYDYCIQHILEDKNAPYRPCSYTYPNTSKRCSSAAFKSEKDKRDMSFCQMHLWKMLLKRQKSNAKNFPPMTTESLLSELSHYVRPARLNSGNSWPKSDNANAALKEKEPSTTSALNPFIDVNVTMASLQGVQVLECASESDSDTEPAMLDSVWRGADQESSDNESVDDSQFEDPLGRANVYTAEEVVMCTRNKMARLQMLYHRQFEKLTKLFKEKRRNYLIALKREKETAGIGPIHSQPRKTAKEQRMYEKLKALNRYHRLSKRESLAPLLYKEKKNSWNMETPKPATKCSFTEGGVRCLGTVIPATKYCLKHVLQDTGQCLFRACGCAKLDTLCQEPIVEIGSDDSCILHLKLPALPHSTLCDVKDDGNKSEGESEMDASATESAFSTDNRDSPEAQAVIDDLNADEQKPLSSKEQEVVEESVLEEVIN